MELVKEVIIPITDEDKPRSLSSKDDSSRKELLWELREEELMLKWKEEMKTQANLHRKKGRQIKKLYAVFGLPASLIPIILSGLSEQFENHMLAYNLLMIFSGTLVGISTFFNLGKRFTQHFQYEHRYLELALDIEKEIRKPKRFRQPCDVYMEAVYLKYCNLNGQAPLVGSPEITERKISKK